MDKTPATLQTIIKNYNDRGHSSKKPRFGRPKKLNDRDIRSIIRKVTANPRISAPKLPEDIANTFSNEVHPEAVRRVLRPEGFNGRVPRKKPWISEVNRQKGFYFVKSLENGTFHGRK